MKKMTNGLLLIGILFVTSCVNTIDKSLNKDDLTEINDVINTDTSFSKMKKAYIKDNLSMLIGLIEVGKAMDVDESKIPTFGDEINDLSIEFDSIRDEKLQISENNKKLKEFIELIDANTASLTKYKGYLTMKLKFNNHFEKEVLYIVINYKYVNKYDSEFFNEKTKLTDEIAGDFKGELEVMTTEKYNDVAEFMYTKVPVQASLKLRKELGVEEANTKVKKDFLMNGLNIETLLIVFKDKSELTLQKSDWKYLEE